MGYTVIHPSHKWNVPIFRDGEMGYKRDCKQNVAKRDAHPSFRISLGNIYQRVAGDNTIIKNQ